MTPYQTPSEHIGQKSLIIQIFENWKLVHVLKLNWEIFSGVCVVVSEHLNCTFLLYSLKILTQSKIWPGKK